MNRRCRTHALLGIALGLSPLPAASAAQGTAVRINLRIVEGCALDSAVPTASCAVAHQRSDAPAPPPPQVQALTPALEPGVGSAPERPWLTLTF